MSLLSLLSYKNAKRRNPKVIEASFDDLLKDYNFENNQDDFNQDNFNQDDLDILSGLNLTETTEITKLEPVIESKPDTTDISNNSDIEEDSPFNDSENEN
jgi:hypothetical protein